MPAGKQTKESPSKPRTSPAQARKGFRRVFHRLSRYKPLRPAIAVLERITQSQRAIKTRWLFICGASLSKICVVTAGITDYGKDRGAIPPMSATRHERKNVIKPVLTPLVAGITQVCATLTSRSRNGGISAQGRRQAPKGGHRGEGAGVLLT